MSARCAGRTPGCTAPGEHRHGGLQYRRIQRIGRETISMSSTVEVDLRVDGAELERLVTGQHYDPHHVLGAHPVRDDDGRERVVIRGWRPDAVGMAILAGEQRVEMRRVHPAGVFAGVVDGREHPGLSTGGDLPGRGGGRAGRSVPVLAHAGGARPLSAGRGPARGVVAPSRGAGAGASGHIGHVVRGVGARRPRGSGRRGLQRLGRPDPPDESPWQLRGLGDLPARRRARRALQVRGRHPAGPCHAAGGSVRLRRGSAAGHRQHRRAEQLRLARRRVVRSTGRAPT